MVYICPTTSDLSSIQFLQIPSPHSEGLNFRGGILCNRPINIRYHDRNIPFPIKHVCRTRRLPRKTRRNTKTQRILPLFQIQRFLPINPNLSYRGAYQLLTRQPQRLGIRIPLLQLSTFTLRRNRRLTLRPRNPPLASLLLSQLCQRLQRWARGRSRRRRCGGRFSRGEGGGGGSGGGGCLLGGFGVLFCLFGGVDPEIAVLVVAYEVVEGGGGLVVGFLACFFKEDLFC